MSYVCRYHNQPVEGNDACPQCMAERAMLPAIEDMTATERAQEFEMWINRDQLTVDWGVFVDRLEKLLGRDIWTHELASSNCPNLVKEAWGDIPHPQYLDEITASLPAHLRDNVIIFNPSNDNSREFGDN